MSNGNHFKTSQLLELGFRQNAQGQWSKDHLKNRDQRPPIAERKPDPGRKAKRKNEAKKIREASHENSYRYRLIIHSFRTRLLDFSNVHLKAIEDTLVTEGVIPDDSPKYCDQPLILETEVKKGNEKTVIEVLKYKIT